MRYNYRIGNYCLRIVDDLELIRLDFPFFEQMTNNDKYDAICVIKRYNDCKDLPKGLMKMYGKLIEGDLRGRYYSILVNRKIIIISDKNTKVIDVYADDEAISIMSVYSFFVCLKKHVINIFSSNDYIMFHGALVYDPWLYRAYLILGESGGGKSSLSYMLLQNGMSLLSDDIVVIDTNCIKACGSGGYLYVTEDFVNRFGIKEYKVVSPGRKMRVAVNTCTKTDVDIFSVMIAAGTSSKESYIITKMEEACEEMQNTQNGWIGYKEDCISIINLLALKTRIHKVFLNSNTKNYIENIVAK